MREILEGKIRMIECMSDNIIDSIERLKKKYAIEFEENMNDRDKHKEAIRFVAYMDALEDVASAVELCRDGYIECLCDNYEENRRIEECDRVEMSNIQDDIFDDMIDDNDDDIIPF